MLNSRPGIFSAIALAALAGSGVHDLPVPAAMPYSGPSRGRSRTPWGNTYQPDGRYGRTINRDTGTIAGVPGSKLARKAAEGRVGVYTGKAKAASHRALTK